MGTLKPAPDLFLRSIVGAHYYDADEHRCVAIVAHRPLHQGKSHAFRAVDQRSHATYMFVNGLGRAASLIPPDTPLPPGQKSDCQNCVHREH
jgi:hypothetical protein